ncbi:hypothetical protein KVR01_001593 [Diaporthe batatas]|uniref:uncharacterized protein n=1 Tax=Diaporthe batatas TaxID=748121 RepID=UPI001D03F8DC|nr:uncharacterized protein KVR01_001593 [Diaporthe batatas]KAG8168844.1 hypothetical protein KVR01_001593 [Diaporthe batatas]
MTTVTTLDYLSQPASYAIGFHGAGPLTTVFTTPDFCASLYWTDTATPPLSSLVCMPPKFHSLYAYSFGFYSPGICPKSWTKGCEFPYDQARTDDAGGMIYFGGPVLQSETVQVCCPNGYTCLTDGPSSYSKCAHTTDSSELAFALQVRWQESDLSILATDPTVPGSTYSATATATPGSTGSNTDAPTPSSSSGPTKAQNDDPGSESEDGLPSSTIIGIAIGVGGVVVALAVSAVGFFIWRHRKKKREATTNGTRIESMISGFGDSKPSPTSGGGFPPDDKAELDSRARASTTALSEAPVERDAVEMPPLHIAATEMEVPHFVAELPGSMPAGYDDYRNGSERAPETDVPGSPLPTAETSQRESGVLGQMGHWKKRSVARSHSQLRPISRSSASSSSTQTAPTIEDFRPSPI